MTIKKLTDFEIAVSAGLISLSADLIWLINDIVANGLSLPYLGIGIGLSLGILLTGRAWYKHLKSRKVKLLRVRKPSSIKSDNGDSDYEYWMNH